MNVDWLAEKGLKPLRLVLGRINSRQTPTPQRQLPGLNHLVTAFPRAKLEKLSPRDTFRHKEEHLFPVISSVTPQLAGLAL